MPTDNRNTHDVGDSPGPLTQGVAAAIGATVGFGIGDASGAIVGAAAQPAVAVILHRALDEIGLVRTVLAGRLLDDAADRLDKSADDMVKDALSDPRRALFLGEALQAAARTANESKLKALSRALANGLGHDTARLDEEQLVILALAEVDTPHIKLLVQLGPERRRTRVASTGLRSRTAPGRGRAATQLAEQCNMSEPAARAALTVLQRAGLAAQDETADIERYDRLIMELQEEVNKLIDLALKPPKDGKVQSGSRKPRELKRPGSPSRIGWYITPFGSRCLAYLEDIEGDDDAEDYPG